MTFGNIVSIILTVAFVGLSSWLVYDTVRRIITLSRLKKLRKLNALKNKEKENDKV